MKKSVNLKLIIGLLVLAFAAVACQPQIVEVEKEVQVTVEVDREVVVEKEVEKIVEVEVEKIVEVEVEKIVEVEVEKIVEIKIPVIVDDPNRTLNIIAVQHAECAWDSFWCTVQAGILQGALDNDVNVTILAPDSFDVDKTASLIEQAVAAQPDAIMLTVTDATLFKGPIQAALDLGIPVVAYNAGAGPNIDGIGYLTYLGQDEYAGGYLGGQRLSANGGTKGVCVNHVPGHTGVALRCSGFEQAMTEAGIAYEELAVNDDPAESATILGDYYASNPEADIWITMGPNGAVPFYAFMDNEGLTTDDITHGTFDNSPEITANILNGTTMFGIDQQPFLQGYGAVTTLSLAARYGILPAGPVTATGPGFITADTIGEFPGADAPMKIIAVQHAECAWDAFWCVVQNGATTAAARMNIDLQILAPDSFDIDKTASLIEQAVAAEPDAIMLTVTDPVVFKDAIDSALAAGIPVVAYNSGAGPGVDNIDYATYLGQDEYAGGYQGGQRLAALGGTKGVCVNHAPGHTGVAQRCAGFEQAMTEAGLDYEELVTNDDPAESATIIGDYYASNPDADIFITMGPGSAIPFYQFMDNEGLTQDDIVHGTFDLSPEIAAMIQSGVTQFGIDQQPFLQGYGAVQALNLMVRHGVVPALPVTPTGPGFVTVDNLTVVQALAGEFR
ncbi:MAG: simple sugar transport system substrate-binding protein [Cellvibrionaceae bacterium]|jgi:simple sugar transport system substrate-binding protein